MYVVTESKYYLLQKCECLSVFCISPYIIAEYNCITNEWISNIPHSYMQSKTNILIDFL